jgi:hypothetical protein
MLPTGATILFADQAALDRLSYEGGLLPSFLEVFRGSIFDTADDSPTGDGIGVDDGLARPGLLGVDASLLAPTARSSNDFKERERYRHNFIRKIAARQHVWLKVLDGEAAQREGLAALVDQLRLVVDECRSTERHAVIVLVFTAAISTESLEFLRTLRDTQGGVARIYVMTQRLQPAARASRAISAHAVWPICVARLLIARALLPAKNEQSGHAKLVAWRSLAWGRMQLPPWTVYRSMIRQKVLPSKDEEGDTTKRHEQAEAPAGLVASTPPSRGIARFAWMDRAEDLHHAGFASLGDAVFGDVLRESGQASLEGRALKAGIQQIKDEDGKATGDWGHVAEKEAGLNWLRRIAHGRRWVPISLGELLDKQRGQWGSVTRKRRDLDIAREHHRDAVEELAIARSRHLSLLWRFIIAGVVMLFVGQFLASVLLPLRSATAHEPAGSSDFLGVQVPPGTSVAFLVDCSGSMAGERIELLRSELSAAIQDLKSGTLFTIVRFTHETTDGMCLPSADRTLIPASAETKQRALGWIESDMQAGGLTDPSDGLERILAIDPLPSNIVLMTDGQFRDPTAVRSAIEQAEARCKASGTTMPKIHTVALWQRNEEPLLQAIQARTGGSYSFVGFDPFAPLGFSAVVTIILLAAAIGVTLGAVVPYLLELWRGRKGVGLLRASMIGLMQEFCLLTVEMQRLLRNAYQFRTSHRFKAAGERQRRLASRALNAVEQCLDAERRQANGGPRTAMGTRSALAGEDRRDLAMCLDIGIEGAPPEVEPEEAESALQEDAKKHAEKLKTCWSELCEKCDASRSGHLPWLDVRESFGRLLDRLCGEAAEKLLLHHLSSRLAGFKGDQLTSGIKGHLASTESVPEGLSLTPEVPSGKVPPARRWWYVLNPEESTPISVKQALTSAKDGFKPDAFPDAGFSALQVQGLGLACLGLLHEELTVDFTEEEPAEGREFVLVGGSTP